MQELDNSQRTKISSWGNSEAIRIPKNLMSEAGLSSGDDVNIRVNERGNIEVAPKRRHPSCVTDVAFVLALDCGDDPVRTLEDNVQERWEAPLIWEEDPANFGVPRPLKTHEGRTFLQCAVDACAGAGIRDVTIVRLEDEHLLDDAVQALCANVETGVAESSCAAKRSVERHPASVMETMRIKQLRVVLPTDDTRDGLAGLPAAVLQSCFDCTDHARGIFVLTSAQPCVQAHHLLELKNASMEHECCSYAAYYSEWRVVPPLYVPGTSDRAKLAQTAGGSVRMLDAVIVDAGRERIAGKELMPQNFEQTMMCDAKNTSVKRIKHRAAGRSKNAVLNHANDFARSVREQFPAFVNGSCGAYLDSASTTERPQVLLDAQREFDEQFNANTSRGAHDLTRNATHLYECARAQVAAFIGANPHQIAFTSNCTDSINLVAQAWAQYQLREGDTIAVCIAEHHSDLMPWMLLSERIGVKLTYFTLLPSGHIDMQSLDCALAKHPKLVCVAHVSNVLGLVNPIKQIATKAHAAGAKVLVDAAQSVAHIPLDIHELGADFLAFSAHKVYGPMGLGVLYAADEVASQMQPTSVGGGAIVYSSLDDFRTREFPSGFEAGTQRVQQAVGFGAVCEWLNQLNMASVQQHGQAIATYAIERLGQLPYVSIYGEHSDANEVCGLVSFAVAGVKPHVVSALLSQMGVSVRGNTLCAAPLMHAMGLLGTVRASFGIYTTCDQIDLLIEGIRRAHLRISGKPMRW